MTPLKIPEIIAQLKDGKFHPHATVIRDQLRKLFGPDYAHYHTHEKSDRTLQRTRIRCVKYDQLELAAFLEAPSFTDIAETQEIHIEEGYVPPSATVTDSLAPGYLDHLRVTTTFSLSDRLAQAELHRPDSPFRRHDDSSPFKDGEGDVETVLTSQSDPDRMDIEMDEKGTYTATTGYNQKSLSAQGQDNSIVLQRSFQRILQNTLSSRCSIYSVSSGVSSGVRSLLSSVARISFEGTPRPLLQLLQAQPNGASNSEPSSSSRRRANDLRSVLAKANPLSMLGGLPRKLNVVFEEIVEQESLAAGEIPLRFDVLSFRRKYCPLEVPLRDNSPIFGTAGRILNKVICTKCRYSINHSFAASCLSVGLMDKIPSFYGDIFGNTPLHFLASRSAPILDDILALHRRGVNIAVENTSGQSFLFALGPEALGPDLLALSTIIELFKPMNPWKRDHHGQMFVQCILPKLENEPHGFRLYGRTFLEEAMLADNVDLLAVDNRGISIADLLEDLIHYDKGSNSSSKGMTPIANWGERMLGGRSDSLIRFEGLRLEDPAGIRYYFSQARPHIDSYDFCGDTVLTSCIKIYDSASLPAGASAPPLIKNVLLNRPNIHMRDRDGNTAIVLAAAQGLPHIVRWLLQAGATPITENYEGDTLYEVVRDSVVAANKIESEEGVFKVADILCSLFTILDFVADGKILFKKHRYRAFEDEPARLQ